MELELIGYEVWTIKFLGICFGIIVLVICLSVYLETDFVKNLKVFSFH